MCITSQLLQPGFRTDPYNITHPEEISKRWSKQHTGIGSDGLVLIGRSDKADFSMRIFNADGSEAMMCGNATRCIGKYVYDQRLTAKTTITLDTLSGIKTIKLHINNKEVNGVTINMGIPAIKEQYVRVTANKIVYEGTVVSMGNPHFVIITDDVSKIDLPTVGPLIENNPIFPDRTNVEFVEIKNKNHIRMKVWERGSGITMACGTGACATLAACAARGISERNATVEMDGGFLSILWDGNNNIQMTGDAVTVFEGDIYDQPYPGIQ